jgi:hypothetical protein
MPWTLTLTLIPGRTHEAVIKLRWLLTDVFNACGTLLMGHGGWGVSVWCPCTAWTGKRARDIEMPVWTPW